MSWQTFYLAAFLAGFSLTAISVAAGFFHLPFHGLHLPHGLGHGAPAVHGGGEGAGTGAGPGHGHGHGASVTPLNFATATAFLAWFGGVGYLLTGHSRLASFAVLALAAGSGAAGAGIVFAFLARVLLRHESALDPADFEMVGVLGRITVPIRPGGTGEITFSQGRTRRCAGARRDGEGEVRRGSEVVVTRYENGIAYVRPWEEL